MPPPPPINLNFYVETDPIPYELVTNLIFLDSNFVRVRTYIIMRILCVSGRTKRLNGRRSIGLRNSKWFIRWKKEVMQE